MLGTNSIDPRHRQEWANSRVSETIIALNVRSFTDPRELDDYLDRNTHNRWRHSTAAVPGWGVVGVDPKTGERNPSAFQYKADNPEALTNESGRAPKYLQPSGAPPRPIFLDPGDRSYWPGILQDPGQPIYIVEGAKKAGCLLSLGLPAVAITGCYNGTPGKRLNDEIALFCTGKRKVFLLPDGDWRDNWHVSTGWSRLGQLIEKQRCPVFVVVWDEAYKGIDDYAASGGDVLQVVSDAISFKEWKKEIKAAHKESLAPAPSLTQERIVPLLEEKFGDRVRLNLLTQDIEIGGVPIDADIAYLAIGGELGCRISKDLCNDALALLAKRHAYNPVVEYLERLQEPKARVDINKLATTYLGTTDPLYDVFVKKFLIGAVARALNPGCKLDTALILQGPQGIGKSSFFRILGDPWFDDSMGPLDGKDDLMVLHRAWLLEWGELEFVTDKRHSSDIKRFLSRTTDRFRPPYGRHVKEFPRRSVVCGTTNQTEFLRDETGNRRFWVIPVSRGGIRLADLERDRDAIWYEAVRAYKSGERWWLTAEESEESETRNQNYLPTDPWETIISQRLETSSPSSLKTEDILSDWLGIDPSQQNTAHARRIARILESKGYRQERRRVRGARERVWEKLVETSGPSGTGSEPNPGTLSTQGFADGPDSLPKWPECRTHLGHPPDASAQMPRYLGHPCEASGPPPEASPRKDFRASETPLSQMAQMISLTFPSEKNDGTPPSGSQGDTAASCTPPPPASPTPKKAGVGDWIRVRPESPYHQICLSKLVEVIQVREEGVIVWHPRWIQEQTPLIRWEHIASVSPRAAQSRGDSPSAPRSLFQ